jgi:imidazole glycerol-phosphate synthase subunit HisH
MTIKTVAVVDYGMGNLRSVTQAVQAVASDANVEVIWAKTPQEVMDAERVVLPGQGGMRDCMRELHDSGMLAAVLHAAKYKPLMGVCVGMQMLLDHSEELDTPCLGLIPGEVVKFAIAGQIAPDGSRYKVPQMGWNQVFVADHAGQYAKHNGVGRHPIWGDVPDGSYFYFVHSYYAKVSEINHSVGETEFGSRFTSAIARDNIFATQFHPEKSASQGLTLYRNFLHWKP